MPLHPRSAELTASLAKCAAGAQPWEGVAYRFVTMPYANRADLLSGAGSRHHGGRWNPPGQFNVIYGSLDPEAAMAESLGTFTAFGIPPEKARPRAFVAIRLKLQSVLNLTSARVAGALKMDLADLGKEDWQAVQAVGDESTAQAIGRICWELRLEAILAPSFRKAGAANIVLFPGRRLRGSSWKIQGARDLPKKRN